MNKKIALSGLSILTALALMGGAVFAFFSSQATSNNNLFGAGNLVLQLDDNDESASATVTGSIGVGTSAFAPGDDVDGFISLHNDGSIDIAEVEMGTAVTETADPGADSFLADKLNVTVQVDTTTGTNGICDTPTNLTSSIDSAVGDGSTPLTLTEMNGDTFDAITPGLAAGDTRDLCINVAFDNSAGNIYQGDAIDVDFTFTGNQDASQ